ncbi:hypothetical protein OLMES_1296 [Oleiphilus messinensis]|uniref:Phosphodiester glycosidase domain-containing protein n=1 Tax=Oleiphilus messinensis TaxID=141451 RepID=A0A1Y0I789_9GAMM|nr:hypothetical protein [Oleiphilus messinensis]ARU55375.1 hypothetical protein OLMES_1296 [Oleiphilus messinensis]
MAKNTLESATSLHLGDSTVWKKFQSASSAKQIGFFKAPLPSGGPLYIVSLSSQIKMIPFVRTDEELFDRTAKRESKANKFRVVINGPTYGLTNSGKLDAVVGSDPVLAKETLQQGLIVQNRRVIGGTKSNMYYIANYPGASTKYKFGSGFAPSGAMGAVGNVGPLILNGLPFGRVNKYVPEQPDAAKVGEPSLKHAPHLVQRSNKRFDIMSDLPDPVGKIVVGYRQDIGQMLILVQPHNTRGISISGLRGIAQYLKLDSAVYLDGSDSVLLMIDDEILLAQGSNKNETNVTGIGFVY